MVALDFVASRRCDLTTSKIPLLVYFLFVCFSRHWCSHGFLGTWYSSLVISRPEQSESTIIASSTGCHLGLKTVEGWTDADELKIWRVKGVSNVKEAGMLVGQFDFKPLREAKLGVAQTVFVP